MNKKLKSLLIAGLLVVNMGGFAFATGDGGSGDVQQYTSTITNPKLEEGQKEYKLQNGAVILQVTRTEEGNYLVKVKWDSNKVKVVGVKTHYKDGYMFISETQFKDGEDCNTIIKGEDGWYQVNLSDLKKEDLVKIEVMFEPVKNDDPVVPPAPEEPEEEVKDDPATGDASMLATAGLVVIAGASLVYLKKKDEE